MKHPSLAAGRWHKLSLAQQLGNIGSEVGRAVNAVSVQDKKLAAARAIELLDLTLQDERWYGRGSELARAKEVTADFLLSHNTYKSTAKSIEDYFMQFALLARIKK